MKWQHRTDFLKLLAARSDEELEKEIAAMQDNQKNLMIKAFVKILKGYDPVTKSYSKDMMDLFN